MPDARTMRIEVGETALHAERVGERGTLVVLTHGLGSDLRFWDAHVDALAAHHRVVRWDLRGAGASSRPPGPYDVALFARDLAAVLDACGERDAHVVGHSGGGAVAQRFALDFPDRVRSLLLASTSSEVGAHASEAWLRLADRVERSGFGASREADARGFAPAFASAHPDVVAAVTARTRANAPAAYAAAARAFGTYRWTAELPRIRVPVLILQGLEDRLTPPGGSVILSRGLPRARLLMLPGAGHNLPLEQPELFTTAALAFLAGVDGASGGSGY